MKFSRFDTLPAAVRYFTRPRLNTPAAVMSNAALAVAELERLRQALRDVAKAPHLADCRHIAERALQRTYYERGDNGQSRKA